MPAHDPHRLQVDPIDELNALDYFASEHGQERSSPAAIEESAEADDDSGFLQANFAAESVALIGVRPPGDRSGDAS